MTESAEDQPALRQRNSAEPMYVPEQTVSRKLREDSQGRAVDSILALLQHRRRTQKVQKTPRGRDIDWIKNKLRPLNKAFMEIRQQRHHGQQIFIKSAMAHCTCGNVYKEKAVTENRDFGGAFGGPKYAMSDFLKPILYGYLHMATAHSHDHSFRKCAILKISVDVQCGENHENLLNLRTAFEMNPDPLWFKQWTDWGGGHQTANFNTYTVTKIVELVECKARHMSNPFSGGILASKVKLDIGSDLGGIVGQFGEWPAEHFSHVNQLHHSQWPPSTIEKGSQYARSFIQDNRKRKRPEGQEDMGSA